MNEVAQHFERGTLRIDNVREKIVLVGKVHRGKRFKFREAPRCAPSRDSDHLSFHRWRNPDPPAEWYWEPRKERRR